MQAYSNLLSVLYLVCTLFLLNISSSLVQAQTFGDISLPSNSFEITDFYEVFYEFEPAGNITIAIRLNEPNQFFGLGWGTSMNGSDIWVFNIINSSIVATDRSGRGHQEPILDGNLGGEDNLKVLGYELTSSYSFVKVRRALSTGDELDAIIKPGSNNIIWATAMGSPTVRFHGKTHGIMQVNLVDS